MTEDIDKALGGGSDDSEGAGIRFSWDGQGSADPDYDPANYLQDQDAYETQDAGLRVAPGEGDGW